MTQAVLLAVSLFQIVVSQEYAVPENTNIDEILRNDRLTRNYLDCVLGKGQCTPDGEELKKNIPDALENECARCSERHKEGIRKVIHHLIEKKPEWWKEFEAKYDPNGDYKKKYENYLKEEGLKI